MVGVLFEFGFEFGLKLRKNRSKVETESLVEVVLEFVFVHKYEFLNLKKKNQEENLLFWYVKRYGIEPLGFGFL